MTENIVRFEGPPPSPVGGRWNAVCDYKTIASELRASPGEWGIVAEFDRRPPATAPSHRIRHGLNAAFRPSGTYKAVSREVADKHIVYAMYVGKGGEST